MTYFGLIYLVDIIIPLSLAYELKKADMTKHLHNDITGSLAWWVESSSMVQETGVQPWSGHTKDFKNGTWYLFA